ncbi:MAG: hypothetical protein WCT08_02130 [Patescibacteria group bacterium]|jgi:hypothetical protein
MTIKFPYIISLKVKDIKTWKKYYSGKNFQWDRSVDEGIWRRTQEKENAFFSGYHEKNDRRRRMIHFRHTYGLVKDKHNIKALALQRSTIWLNYCFPNQEINQYLKDLNTLFIKNNWTRNKHFQTLDKKIQSFSKSDLNIELNIFKNHPADLHVKRIFPKNYSNLEISIFSHKRPHPFFINRAFTILNSGMRKKDKRGNPKIINNVSELIKFFPAQVELGCGPAIEAKIPPLHYLHSVYSVGDPISGKFTLSLSEDRFVRNIIIDQKESFHQMTYMYITCLTAKPSQFYKHLTNLHKKGYIVGSIITNNFDGLATKSGLKELMVRRFDEQHLIPNIQFHPKAKSLIVIGSHADRRKIQHAARRKKLKVLYIDPEGYLINGKFISYPLESVQNDDALVKKCAGDVFLALMRNLKEIK